jgi:peptidoglycan/xylan/chitin deacetylase (PgdA/CDA1 family)
MMSSAQLRAVHAQGIAIGAHTVSHPILLKLDAQRARSEGDGSRKKLEPLLDAPVSLFAYPNGRPDVDYGVEHVRMVKDPGFEAAVSTAWGVCHSGSDRHQLPRFTPWDREIPRFVLRLWHRLLGVSGGAVSEMADYVRGPAAPAGAPAAGEALGNFTAHVLVASPFDGVSG